MSSIKDSKLSQKRLIATNFVGLFDQPRRTIWKMLVVFVLFELFLVAMHFVVSGPLGGIASRTADGHIGGFDLNDEATLAVWFSSFQLLLISVFCLLNSWVDRALFGNWKPQGFWKFGFVLFLVMCIDETAGLHEIFGKAMVIVFPMLPISPSMWWTIPYAICVAAFLLFLGNRLIRRPSLLAMLALFVISWFFANALEHVHKFSMTVNFAIEEGLEMFGATALLFVISSFFAIQVSALEDQATSQIASTTENQN